METCQHLCAASSGSAHNHASTTDKVQAFDLSSCPCRAINVHRNDMLNEAAPTVQPCSKLLSCKSTPA